MTLAAVADTLSVRGIKYHVPTLGDAVERKPMGRAEVAALIGVKPKTVNEYRLRYRGTGNPFPEPDGYIGRTPYWNAERVDEIRAWDAKRPGRGNAAEPPQ